MSYIGATFSTIQYSEYNVPKNILFNIYDENTDNNFYLKNNLIQLKYENLKKNQEDIDKTREIKNIIWQKEYKKMKEKEEIEIENKKKRLYYLYNIYYKILPINCRLQRLTDIEYNELILHWVLNGFEDDCKIDKLTDIQVKKLEAAYKRGRIEDETQALNLETPSEEIMNTTQFHLQK